MVATVLSAFDSLLSDLHSVHDVDRAVALARLATLAPQIRDLRQRIGELEAWRKAVLGAVKAGR